MRHHQHGNAALQGGDGLGNGGFRRIVEGGRSFVEDEETGFVIEGTGDSDTLALAAGESNSALADGGIEALWKALLDEIEDVRGGGDIVEAFLIDIVIGQAQGDVAGQGVVDEKDILGHVTDAGLPGADVIWS